MLFLVVNIISAQSNQQRAVAGKSQTTVQKTTPKPRTQTASKTTQKSAQVKKTATKFCPDNKHPHAIDLGLPSETLWSCCNVGANIPEEQGGLYAIGELKEKKAYTLLTYKYHEGTTNWNSGFTCPWVISGTENDVAHVKLGNGWQMPTYAQCKELAELCTFEFITIDTIKGAKLFGPNGNVIFLPANNDGEGSYASGSASGHVNVPSGYWTRIFFDKKGFSYQLDNGRLYQGHLIRPVKDER